MTALAGDSRAPRVFLAVTTGQNVSNLPPVLECGVPQRDAVLWLNSELARRKAWSKGATRVLRGRGYRVLESLLLPEEPAGVWQCLVDLHALCDHEGFEPVWVANGGTKPTSLALNVKLDGRPLLPIVYSEPRPVEYWEMPEGIIWPRIKHRYSKARLTLEEVLAASGHFIWNASEAVRFWPGDAALQDDVYGIDAEATGAAHDESDNRRARGALIAAAGTDGEPVPLEVGLDSHIDLVRGWLESVWGASRNLFRTVPERPQDWAQFGHAHLPVLAGLFAGAQRSANRMRRAEAGIRPVAAGNALGKRFEVAVARRVRSWLEFVRGTVPINEAWLNVKVRHDSQPERERAEFDVVLVLANGILLSLECKTFKDLTDNKDLDARLLNLMRSTSQLAQMCVCAPLFTDLAHKPWFASQHELRQRLDGLGFTFIPFTLPGQAAKYEIQRADGALEEFACRPFEEHLNRLLQPYLPGD